MSLNAKQREVFELKNQIIYLNSLKEFIVRKTVYLTVDGITERRKLPDNLQYYLQIKIDEEIYKLNNRIKTLEYDS